MTTDLAAVLKRIQALRARAADAASTEGEAEMAARKAAELLAAHNISLSELDVRAEGVGRQRWDSGQQTRPVEAFACDGIDKLCGTRSMYTGGVISIVGAPADVETALYFLDIVRAAVRSTWASFQKNDCFHALRERGLSPRKIGGSFRTGVASRLGERMKAMAAEAASPVNASGPNALVPVKNALIAGWMTDNKIKLRSTTRSTVSSASGYVAGRAAANSVGLLRGVGRARPSGLLT